jgi:PAS domain S-box-containing protein
MRSDVRTELAGAPLYEALVEGCPDAIVVTDRGGSIRFWNAAAEATFGHSAAEAIGASLDLIIPEKLRQRHWAGYDATMASGTTKYGDRSLNVPALHRDGRRLSIEFRVLLLRDRDGAVAGVAAFLRDVTAAWQEKQELRRALAAAQRSTPPQGESG